MRSQAREAYQAYRSAYDIAQHYRRDVLPLRKIITEEMQLRFSSMQVDVFALLTEARQLHIGIKWISESAGWARSRTGRC